MRSHEFAEGIEEFVRLSEDFLPRGYFRQPLASIRESYDRQCAFFHRGHPKGIKVSDRDLRVGSRRILSRLYLPGQSSPSGVTLYFHGGGWVLGGLESHDDFCAELAFESGYPVLSIDYPLAPENAYPIPYQASYETLLHILEDEHGLEIDTRKVVVAGDSAGASIAASVALRACDAGIEKIVGQGLIYPSLGADQLQRSVSQRLDFPLLEHEELAFYRDKLFGGAALEESKEAFPLLRSSFEGFVPAYILAVDLDPLLQDSLIYHEELKKAGVTSSLQVLEGVVHGAIRARAHSPIVDSALTDFARAIGAYFTSSRSEP